MKLKLSVQANKTFCAAKPTPPRAISGRIAATTGGVVLTKQATVPIPNQIPKLVLGRNCASAAVAKAVTACAANRLRAAANGENRSK
jgi:hypothetical protein